MSVVVSKPYKRSRLSGAAMLLRDGEETAERSNAVLERYFHDIYMIFLRKLTQFAADAEVPEAEQQRLSELFEELVKTKALLDREDTVY